MVASFCNEFDLINGGKLKGEMIKGLVGHWGEKSIEGIYLTNVGKNTIKAMSHKNMKIISNGDNSYLELKDTASKKALSDFYSNECKEMPGGEALAEYYFTRCFFSGDYDIHDLFETGKPVATIRDMELFTELQKELIVAKREEIENYYNVDKNVIDFASEIDTNYQRIQHGPQYNYIAQMINENTDCKDEKELNGIVTEVAQMSEPVLYITQKDKPVELDKTKIIEQYIKNGVTVKVTWLDKNEIIKHQNYIEEQAKKLGIGN